MNILQNFATLSNFGIYLAASIALLLVFSFIYLRLTPYDELGLISKGVTSASITFFGATLGFVLPLASVTLHSVSIIDMLIWSCVAMLIQIVTFLFIKWALVGNLAQKIEENNIATSLFVASISVCIGIINSACMSY